MVHTDIGVALRIMGVLYLFAQFVEAGGLKVLGWLIFLGFLCLIIAPLWQALPPWVTVDNIVTWYFGGLMGLSILAAPWLLYDHYQRSFQKGKYSPIAIEIRRIKQREELQKRHEEYKAKQAKELEERKAVENAALKIYLQSKKKA